MNNFIFGEFDLDKKHNHKAKDFRNFNINKSEDYPTPPYVTRALMDHIGKIENKSCWEPAANRGFMVKVLQESFKRVVATDLYDYGKGYKLHNFLDPVPESKKYKVDWIITNPPFKSSSLFVKKALTITSNVAILQRLQWLEAKSRYHEIFSKTPPAYVLVFTSRVHMSRTKMSVKQGGHVCFAWFVWKRNFKNTKIKWLHPDTKAIYEKPGDLEEPEKI